MKFLKVLTILLATSLFFGCYSTETKDPKNVYKYWLGVNPPKDLELINGQYYQSPHFTLEYELFLEMKVTKQWWKDFRDLNKLEIDSLTWEPLTEIPSWFYQNHQFVKYKINDDFNRSRYFINPKNGKCFIYETLGM